MLKDWISFQNQKKSKTKKTHLSNNSKFCKQNGKKNLKMKKNNENIQTLSKPRRSGEPCNPQNISLWNHQCILHKFVSCSREWKNYIKNWADDNQKIVPARNWLRESALKMHFQTSFERLHSQTSFDAHHQQFSPTGQAFNIQHKNMHSNVWLHSTTMK